MRLQHEPHAQAGNELQRTNGAGREVHDEASASVHLRDNERAARLQRFQSARQDVAGAEGTRRFGGKQNVTGTDGHLNRCARRRRTERDFQFAVCGSKRDAHDPVRGTLRDHMRIQKIFEPGGLGQRDPPRCIENGAGSAAFLNPAIDERDDPFADGVHFFAIVRHVQYGNLISGVPRAKVLQDRLPQRGVQAGERLIEQQQLRLRHQRARQGDPLLFSAGKFRGLAAAQSCDVKGQQNALDALLALRRGERRKTIGDILFNGKMREERERLKNVGSTAQPWRPGEMARGVEETFVVEFDHAGIRAEQPGDAIKQRGLPCAGGAEEHREARGECFADVEKKRRRSRCAKLFVNVNEEHGRCHFASHGDHTRRFMP